MAETLGFEIIWLATHFVSPNDASMPWYDCWTLLAGLATKTCTIYLGHYSKTGINDFAFFFLPVQSPVVWLGQLIKSRAELENLAEAIIPNLRNNYHG